jgi:hypothetical protein
MRFAVFAAILILGADALLALWERKGLIERVLGERMKNPWFRRPMALFYAGLILFVATGGFRALPWNT